MAVLYTQHFVQFFDDNGNPLSGGKLYSYEAGTTTPKATYTTAAGTVSNANPVVLDSAGRAVIFIDGSYRFDLYTSADVLIKSVDNITNFTTTGDTDDAFFETFSGDGSTKTFTLSEDLGTDEKVIMAFTEFEYTLNGDFATDSDWTKGTGWSIGSGVATATGAISTDLEQDAAKTLVEGELYTITMTITRSAGSITPNIGGTAGTARSSSGTYTENIIAGSTQKITFSTSGFTGTVDDVSVTKVSGEEYVSTSLYTLSGTSLTFTVAPATGTNNIKVTAPSRLAGAAAAAAAAAATDAAAAAASAATSLVGTGFQYGFDSDTTATDPGSGDIKFDNATLSSVTEVYISETTDQSQSIGDVLASWDDSTSTVKGTVTIFEQSDQTNFVVFKLDSRTDNGGWDTLGVTYVDHGGSFTADDVLTVKFTEKGDKGDTGATGATGSVSATSAVVAATTAGASLQSSNANNCLSWGSGGSANLTLNSNMSGASTYKLTNMADPSSAQDYATKNYVDSSTPTGSLIDVQVFTSNGTWTKPSGCNQAKVIVVGGGGGGGGASTNNAAGGGGGAGGTAIKFITSGLGSTETVTIGAAGTAGGSGGTAGGSGGSSSFGAHCSATGGGGGDPSGGFAASGGSGGAGSSGDINLNGGGGGGGSDTAGAPSGIGGASYFGGGGAGDLNESAGQAGQAYGSGGAGGRRFSTSQAGGAGKAGIIIVESYT